ncbi:MAG: glycosyltransferase family 39 protein [bacterium]|nr:glycosyltransferase family 39 protein [bacterium]
MFSKIRHEALLPLYLILLKIWGAVFGNGVWSLRSLSVLFGVLTVWIGYLFVKELFQNKTDKVKSLSLISALLLAINPWLVLSSMQTSTVALASFLVLLSSYLWLKTIRENTRKTWLVYAISLGLGLYTHYFFVFVLITHLGFTIYDIFKQKKDWRNALGAYLLAALLFLPWLPRLSKDSTFFDNYFVFISLFLTIIVAFLLLHIPWIKTRRVSLTIFVLANLVGFGFFSSNLDTKNNPGMAGAHEYIRERASETDKIFLGSKFVYASFIYYNQTTINPQLISQVNFDDLPDFQNKSVLAPEAVVLESEILNNTESDPDENIWLIWTTGFDQSKPNVPGGWTVVEETEFGDTPKFKGNIIVTHYYVK